MKRSHVKRAIFALALLAILAAGGCRLAGEGELTDGAAPGALSPASLEQGEKLRVVATTSLIADVAANVGGDRIELAQLIPTGADPHGFTPAPQDLRTLNDAHVIFVNGLGLEESLLPVLENLDRPVPLVTVNDGIAVIELGESAGAETEEEHADEGGHDHGNVDPHAWFSVPNVQVWTGNIATALSVLDPAQAEAYAAAAASYQETLAALDRDLRDQIDAIPSEARKAATDHQALGYLAKEYGIEVVGAIVPSFSTLASASAQEMAALQERIKAEGVKAILVSTTVNPQTANRLAQDLGISVVPIYTGSLSEADGPAATYVDFMRSNVSAIVEALR